MRDHSKHIELCRDEAVKEMLDALYNADFQRRAERMRERVALDESFGRVLAQDVCAKTDLPNALTCMLDSVAVHWEDFEDLGEGELPDTKDWVHGKDWQFANTGIAMPAGFDTAIVIEHVEVSEDECRIEIKAAPSERFAGTRNAGSNVKRGEVVAFAGERITPDVAARISAAGHSSVEVLPRPRVSFLPTGNELVPANLPYSEGNRENYAGYGRVFESNSSLVKGKVEAWGAEFVPFDIVADDFDAIKAAIEDALAVSDIVVLNAGSSKGSDDWSVEVLDELGEMVFHQVKHGPGHHSFFAMVGDKPVVGISGPPSGVTFTLGFYLYPVIMEWLGLDPNPQTAHAVLVGSFGENKHALKTEPKGYAGEERPSEASNPGDVFQNVRFMELYADEHGMLHAKPIPGKAGSAATQHANAIYMLDAGPSDEFPQPGDVIEVELRR